MENFIAQFLALVDGIKLTTILILIVIDLIMGVIVGIKQGKFQLSKVGNFLNTSVLYFLGGYLLLGIVAVAEPAVDTVIVTSAWGLLDLTMIGLILAKAKKLGISIPDKLT